MTRIPQGRVATYGGLARALGDVKAAIWVARYLRGPHGEDGLDHLPNCTCHRVVRATGDLGESVERDVQTKHTRLLQEGVVFDGDVVNISASETRDFELEPPLLRLREFQRSLVSHTELSSWKSVPQRVAGVDLSYPNPGEGVGAFVVYNTQTRLVETVCGLRAPVEFPYISTYLAFRELPLLLNLVTQAMDSYDSPPSVIMVDGSGIAHPRKMGIATMLGVLTGVPTIGVTKKALVGENSICLRWSQRASVRCISKNHRSGTLWLARRVPSRNSFRLGMRRTVSWRANYFWRHRANIGLHRQSTGQTELAGGAKLAHNTFATAAENASLRP